MKPFSDAKILKDHIKTAVNIKFCNISNFKEIRDQISNVQLSDTTCVRRAKILEIKYSTQLPTN